MPGVYLFEDENKKPLYIGKSINIRSRIKQHFEGFRDGTSKALHFFPKTKTLKIKVVNNDIEAIILESNYIRAYQPQYNSISKDDKSQVFIIFTDKPDTKIKIIHTTDIRTLDIDNYKTQIYGPFTNTHTAETVLKHIKNIFGYCLKPLNPRGTSCFNKHIEKCPGICDGTINHIQYQKHIGKIKKFLSGKFTALVKNYKRDIKNYSKKLEFEEANKLKYELQGIESTLSAKSSSLFLSVSEDLEYLNNRIISKLKHPKIQSPLYRIECYDLAHLQGDNYVGSMVVFTNFQPDIKQYRHFNIHDEDKSDPYAMRQILQRRFNHGEWHEPSLILLDGGIPQLSIAGKAVPNHIPVISLAKKKETILYLDEEGKKHEVNLRLNDPALTLLMRLRDEAHRFANTFHSSKHRKDVIYN